MPHASVAVTSGQAPPAPLVRAELDRVLASELFVRSERLSSFLRFIVERSLAGDGKSLKEHTIAVDVYGKDTSFDPAEDPIVRVDARRLRDKLREYYASGGDAGIVITVPKGQYTPVFHTTVATTLPSASASRQPGKRAMFQWALAAAAVVVLAAVIWLVWARIENDPEPQPIIVTALPGAEDDPSLSPDGRSVVFSWGPSTEANHDLWIKSVEGDQKRNLTNTADANNHWPRWSPDGQSITFSRRTKEGSAVIKVSVLGGPEDIVATNASFSSWTADSHGLVYWSTSDAHGHLVYHDLDTGRRWPLTQTPDGFDDIAPRVSPDGKMLAFVRSGIGRSAIFLMPMTGGTPTPLGEWVSGRPIGGLDWLPDSRAVVAGVPREGIRQVMRIPVNGRAPGVPVPGIPSLEAAGMSVSRVDATGRLRLAVSAGEPNVRLRLVDLEAPRTGGAITADSPFCDATRMDSPGRFSPDGQQVAFVSNRDGSFQVWVANRDGSNLHAVTHLKDGATTHVSWSPDAQRLAFDVTVHDHTDIYEVDVSSRAAQRLSDGRDAREPEWSRDGQWIYFSSNRSGSSAIWKMRVDGSGRTQLTSEPGFELRESPDGRSIYFVGQTGGLTRLKQVWVESRLVEAVDLLLTAHNWDVTNAGIVFLAERSEEQNVTGGLNVLQLYDFGDRQIRRIGRLRFPVGPYFAARYLAVSRDGRWALASHLDHYERDIIVLDGFQ